MAHSDEIFPWILIISKKELEMRACLRTFNGQEYSFGEERSPIECFRCGICCIGYHPKVTVEEVELIAEWFSVSADEFINRYITVTKVGYLLRQTENGCVFLTWETGASKVSCNIYSFRPTACRNWVPSLSRPECRQGLVKLQIDNKILLVGEIYENQEQVERFCTWLRQA